MHEWINAQIPHDKLEALAPAVEEGPNGGKSFDIDQAREILGRSKESITFLEWYTKNLYMNKAVKTETERIIRCLDSGKTIKLQADTNAEIQAAPDAESQALRAEYNKTKERLTQTEARLEAAQTETDRVKADSDRKEASLVQTVNTLQQEIRENKAAKNELEARLAEAEKRATELQAENTTLRRQIRENQAASSEENLRLQALADAAVLESGKFKTQMAGLEERVRVLTVNKSGAKDSSNESSERDDDEEEASDGSSKGDEDDGEASDNSSESDDQDSPADGEKDDSNDGDKGRVERSDAADPTNRKRKGEQAADPAGWEAKKKSKLPTPSSNKRLPTPSSNKRVEKRKESGESSADWTAQKKPRSKEPQGIIATAINVLGLVAHTVTGAANHLDTRFLRAHPAPDQESDDA